jgi:hypothetical protein
MLGHNITRCLASFVAFFVLCAPSHADCIRVSPDGTEFTNACSYKVMVEWIDHGSCNARCYATIDSNALYKITKIQVPWRKYECKYDDFIKKACRFSGR